MPKVWIRNFLFFKKNFLFAALWTSVEPLMYLGALGFGFGHYISSIENLSFLEFYFSGLLCTTTMIVSYFENAYPIYSRLTHQKTYAAMLLTPMTTNEIFWGEVLWGGSKGLLAAITVFLISSCFGLFNYKFFMIVPVLFLMGCIFSAFGILVSTWAKSYDSFVFSTTLVIVPLSLISGTYFSLDEIPAYLKFAIQIFPLAHAVELVRSVMYKKIELRDLIHVVVLVLFFIGLSYLGRKNLKRRLIN